MPKRTTRPPRHSGGMRIEVETAPIEQAEADVLLVIAPDKDSARTSLVARLNELTGGWIDEIYTGEFSGKPFETALLHRPTGMKAKRLLLVGGGKPPFNVRHAVAAGVRFLKPRRIGSLAIAVEDGAAAAVEGAILGDYEPDRYKGEKATPVELVRILGADADAVRRAQVIAAAQNFARDLANEPANRLNPTLLARRAQEMAGERGLEFELIDQERMRQIGMGALLGVAQGSAEPPAFIILRYKPEQASGGAHLGIVGKAVTFDSGGISIKPSENMDKMKFDMAGGAAAIAAMRAIAELKPPVQVTVLVPAVENMPDGRAQRPGDIVTTLSGKTVEVLNTDAEGRLILADALTYARRLGCTHLVDVATLTGAIVIALGYVNTGLFAGDDALGERVLDAAKAAGEKMWRMPLDDDYRELLKTPFADLPNVAGRWGGAITAALFLKEFAEDTPWAHLDIAGTAWIEDTKPYLAKGPTGVPVRTLVELVTNWG